ncbi:MAG: 2Fe-2S iron-sulfur cluster binding domain-containing protein [Alphaproteobacteria bacterium]|nr:2Fe-2S iron-sulfur cluster binding domain-containing protein [Alphaproteobacteria bacterium]NCQ88718.1 2Fe-2S iron-sulfur cluster binding domain-containing protein [Alphaproteobacteria bacterium]NCT08184.1 2Fe-2S iron-sulfur cluster binding domain-containing protein [Alphaproteobacteria bacterium]
MKIFVTDPDGIEHELEALEGWRVMEIIKDYGLPLKAECGGACCCATCHVYVSEEWIGKLFEMREDEEDMLDEAMEVRDNSRLSCQILMSEALDGLKVTIAPGTEI